MNKNILLESLDKCIEFCSPLKIYSNKLEQWKNKLLQYDNNKLINEFVELNFIFEKETIDEDMVIDKQNKKTYHNNDLVEPEDEEEIKTDKKNLEENIKIKILEDSDILSFVILNNIFHENEHKDKLLFKFIVENDLFENELLYEVGVLSAIGDTLGLLFNTINTLIKNIGNFINNGNKNFIGAIRSMNTAFDKIKMDTKLILPQSSINLFEKKLNNKLSSMPDEQADLFFAKINKIFGNDTESYQRFLQEYVLNSDSIKYDISDILERNMQSGFLGSRTVAWTKDWSTEYEGMTLTKFDFELLNKLFSSNNLKAAVSNFGDQTWIFSDKQIENLLNNKEKSRLIEIINNTSDKNFIEFDEQYSEEAMNTFFNVLSSNETTRESEQFFKEAVEIINENEDININISTNELYDINTILAEQMEDISTLSNTIFGITAIAIVGILSTVIIRYFRKTRYVKMNCKPGDKVCLYQSKIEELNQTINAVEEVNKKYGRQLNKKSSKALQKKLDKLILIKHKLEKNLNKALEKDKLVNAIMLNKKVRF